MNYDPEALYLLRAERAQLIADLHEADADNVDIQKLQMRLAKVEQTIAHLEQLHAEAEGADAVRLEDQT